MSTRGFEAIWDEGPIRGCGTIQSEPGHEPLIVDGLRSGQWKRPNRMILDETALRPTSTPASLLDNAESRSLRMPALHTHYYLTYTTMHHAGRHASRQLSGRTVTLRQPRLEVVTAIKSVVAICYLSCRLLGVACTDRRLPVVMLYR